MTTSFFLLGAPKAGTTTLYEYLSRHPQIAMSRPKEPAFFACEYDRGLDFYRQTYFSHWNGQPVIGDASTANLHLPWTVPRIAELFPEAKLAVILRCPVRRSYSDWWMHHRSGYDRRSFPDAIQECLLEKKPRWEEPGAEDLWRDRRRALRWGLPFSDHAYLLAGHYAEHIERVWAHFPKERLLILHLDDLEKDAAETLARLWDFLEVRPMPIQIPNAREHRARGPLGERLNRWALMMRLHRVLPPALIRRARDLLIGLGDRPPRPDPATFARLAAYYKPHNERLARLLGRPLEGWL